MLTASDVQDAVRAPRRMAAVLQVEAALGELHDELAPLARLAAAATGAAIGCVTLVKPGALVIAASSTPELEGETALREETSTCAEVVASGAPLFVADCAAEPRFVGNPFVDAGVLRFYAGVPLVCSGGDVIGAVCVFDPDPRATDDGVLQALSDLARQGSALLHHRRQRQEQDAQRDTLEAIASGAPLPDVLDRLTRHVEALVSPGLLCSVLLVDDDGVTLRDGAGPSLPVEYRAAVDGLRAGEGVGSCGTAVHRRTEVVVADITTDPLWAGQRELAARHDLRSCVSSPVLSSEGLPLGTFAFYRQGSTGALHPSDDAVIADFRDLTRVALERDRSRRALVRLATRDTVTGLLNRSAFLDAAAEVLARPPRDGRTHAVLFCDMDHFKMVNDLLGHAAGDCVLVAVADALQRAARPDDVVCRFAGDAFTLVLPDVTPDDAVALAERITASFAAPVQIPDHRVDLSVSVGLATTAMSGTDDLNSLLRDADMAMHEAKSAGRARVRVCDSAMQERAATQLRLSLAMREAVGTDQFRLEYQPEVDARTGALVGCEALLRWDRPGAGPVSPADFIPVAETTGHIVELGRHVLLAACRQAAAWRRDHPAARALTVWVNVSAHQLVEPGFVDTVADALADAGLPGASLGLELTETAVMADLETARATLTALRRTGVRVAVDDFGTGYSSLSILRSLPVDVLKIDRAFIRGLGEDTSSARIVAAIVSTAHALGLGVVAEGVETRQQHEAVRAAGCGTAQGYLFGRPVPPEQFESVLRSEALVPASLRS